MAIFHSFVLVNSASYRRQGILKKAGSGGNNVQQGAFGAYKNSGASGYQGNSAAGASASFRDLDGHGAYGGNRYRGLNESSEENGACGFYREEAHAQEDGAGLDEHIFQDFEHEQEVMKHLKTRIYFSCKLISAHDI